MTRHMKARITIDVTTDRLEWVMKRCEQEGISRNAIIAKALDCYKEKVEAEEKERGQ